MNVNGTVSPSNILTVEVPSDSDSGPLINAQSGALNFTLQTNNDAMALNFNWVGTRDWSLGQDGSGNGSFNISDATAGQTRLAIDSDGNVGIATTAPTQLLDINSDSIRVRTAKTPSSSSDTCDQGQIAWDTDYVYVCVSANTWKRSALSTW